MVKLKLINPQTKDTVFETEVPLSVFEEHSHDEGDRSCGCCGGDPYISFASSLRNDLIGKILEETMVITTFNDEVIYDNGKVLPYDYFNDEFSLVDAIPPALYTVKEIVKARLA